MEALGINLGYLFVQVINFAIIFVVLRAWVYKPILRLLEKRRDAIAQGLEDARIAAEARANAEEQARNIINESHEKASQIVREAAERAEIAAKDVRTQAEFEASKILDEGRNNAAQERDRVFADLRGQVATLAMSATYKLVGETLDEKRQRTLIEEFFSGLKSGKVVILEDAGLSGTSAEVTSALPLTPAEQNLIKKNILAKLGVQSTLSFRVDPSILGGLIVRVGDKVLDGSVAGQLETMRKSLH